MRKQGDSHLLVEAVKLGIGAAGDHEAVDLPQSATRERGAAPKARGKVKPRDQGMHISAAWRCAASSGSKAAASSAAAAPAPPKSDEDTDKEEGPKDQGG